MISWSSETSHWKMLFDLAIHFLKQHFLLFLPTIFFYLQSLFGFIMTYVVCMDFLVMSSLLTPTVSRILCSSHWSVLLPFLFMKEDARYSLCLMKNKKNKYNQVYIIK